MGEKLVIGPINKGLKTDRTPFVIDNDSFPTLLNAYQWRGRVKRKRGTSLLNRLQRFFNSASTAYSPTATITLDASGNGNILTGFSLQSNGAIIPGSVLITDTVSTYTYSDSTTANGTLISSHTSASAGTVDYATGEIVIAAAASHAVNAQFQYYPCLPVMGLEDLNLSALQFPGNLAFDTTNAYNMSTSSPYSIYNVSFYKNPPTGTYPSYVQKTAVTPLSWNGQNYQQFWTANYENSLWTTNGVTSPFTTTNIGMQFKPIVSVTVVAGGPPAKATLQITGHGLVVGDFVFVNEVVTTTGINFQTGYVITVTDANNVIVEFPNATIATNGTGGIAQYLTSTAVAGKDCLRWYDGDPTNGSVTSPGFVPANGWVNFAPPISEFGFSIGDLPNLQYYLVGARLIVPFKDRLLFLGPVIQSSSTGPFYLQDTIIYSQNGTPYYTCSFTGSVTSGATVFTPILTPTNQSAAANAYFDDTEGYGGFITAGFSQPITTVAPNQDVLIVGFTNRKTKVVYSGNDLVPFNFYIVNSDLGDASTFSTITLDRGVYAVGNHGITITNQVQAERIDVEIPDQVFEFSLVNNGPQRVTAQRDYVNEWVYFTYPSNMFASTVAGAASPFPNQTLQYNYRDDSWAIFNECYTTYGQIRRLTGDTWATIGQRFPTWSAWTEPWNAGETTLLQPEVIGGNQQGFVMIRGVGTAEGTSLYISDLSFPATITGATQAASAVLTANNNYVAGENVTISGVVGMTQLNGNTYAITSATPTTITLNVNSTGFGAYVSGGIATPNNSNAVYSPNHGLNNGDYIIINGCIGGSASELNGNIFSVYNVYQNSFSIEPNVTSGSYIGGGLITRMYIPFIQTKQFPVAWGMARKSRIGPQMYLFTTTPNGQVELQMYLSQVATNPYNMPPIVPNEGSFNNSLIYNDILFTCPIPNNLQTPTASQQSQLWQRMNTSLIGDTVQLGITLNDAQMRDTTFSSQFVEIELHSIIMDLNPSSLLV
jgi:hypothetical protein